MAMAMAFTRLSWWLWGRRDHKPTLSSGSDVVLGMQEPDFLNLLSVKGAKMPFSQKRIKRKWHSQEERRIDNEFDVVLVPSDGEYFSGSESDDSDWSIGWLEPHAPDLQSDDDTESSFAVLVPCYGRCHKELVETNRNQLGRGHKELVETNLNQLLGSIGNLDEGKNYMEQWLSSLQNS